MTEPAPQSAWLGAARKFWLAYAAIAVVGSFIILTIYVNAYDDYDISDRLRATGRFARQAMRLFSFPLGFPFAALANGPLEKSFGCGDENEPCAVFIDWHTHFAAVLAQILMLRWLIFRRA